MSYNIALESFASEDKKGNKNVHWAYKFAFECAKKANPDMSDDDIASLMQEVKDDKPAKPDPKPIDPSMTKMMNAKAEYTKIRKPFGKDWKESTDCIEQLKAAGWSEPTKSTKPSKRSEYDAIRKDYGDDWSNSEECIVKLKQAGWKEPSKPKSDEEKIAEAEAKVAVLKAKKAASDDEPEPKAKPKAKPKAIDEPKAKPKAIDEPKAKPDPDVESESDDDI